MSFSESEQKTARQQFIEECRQKAWSAACHADWISKGIDQVMAEYRKLQADDRALETESVTLAGALDSHTKDNRDNRKGLQARRDQLAKAQVAIQQNMRDGQKALQGLYQNVETNLAVAAHAEGWEWKEPPSDPEDAISNFHGEDRYRFMKDWVDHKEGELVRGVEIGDGVVFRDLLANGTIVKEV